MQPARSHVKAGDEWIQEIPVDWLHETIGNQPAKENMWKCKNVISAISEKYKNYY